MAFAQTGGYPRPSDNIDDEYLVAESGVVSKRREASTRRLGKVLGGYCDLVYEAPQYELEDDEWPIFTFLYPLALILFYVAWAVEFSRSDDSISMDGPVGGPQIMFWRVVSPFPDCGDDRFELWRYVSYQMVHGSPIHLGLNCFLFIVVGLPLERVHGTWRMIVLAQVGCIFGGLTMGYSEVYHQVVGASSVVYAFIGVHFANLAMNWTEIKGRCWILFIFSFYIGLDVLIFLFARPEGTSYAGHSGGFIGGLLLGVVLLRNARETETEYIVRVVGWLAMGAYIVFCVLWVGLNWPPRNIMNVRSDEPCCFELFDEDDIGREDYGEFTCDNGDIQELD